MMVWITSAMRWILVQLYEEDQSTKWLIQRGALGQEYITKHLHDLLDLGLVAYDNFGNNTYWHLTDAGIEHVEELEDV